MSSKGFRVRPNRCAVDRGATTTRVGYLASSGRLVTRGPGRTIGFYCRTEQEHTAGNSSLYICLSTRENNRDI